MAMPTRGTIVAPVVERWLWLAKEYPDLRQLIHLGHLTVSEVRHLIVRDFLASDAEWLLMTDDDVVPPKRVLELLRHDADIIGAAYLVVTKAVPVPFPAAFRWDAARERYQPIESPIGRTGFVPCDAVGTGCVAIRRRVLADPQMARPFSLGFDEQGITKLSDDMFFCHRARELGYQIGMDFDLWADHLPANMSLNLIHRGYLDAYRRAAEHDRRRPRILIA